MLILLTASALLWVPPSSAPRLQAPNTLHCRIELAAGAKGKNCRVSLPGGRKIRSCADAERQAGHCDAAGEGRYTVWVVGTGPGRCRISRKKTKWDRVVCAKLSKSEGAPSTCELNVEVR